LGSDQPRLGNQDLRVKVALAAANKRTADLASEVREWSVAMNEAADALAAANKRADGLENALHKLIRGAVRFRAGADQFLGWNASHPHLKLLIEALEEAGVALAALKEPKP
jgi:hypothetical protein